MSEAVLLMIEEMIGARILKNCLIATSATWPLFIPSAVSRGRTMKKTKTNRSKRQKQ